MSKNELRLLVDRFKALSHPVRLRMLALLKGGELYVCQIMEVIGLPVSTTSEHLSELRRAGLLQERREGRWVYVRLTDDPGLLILLDALWASLEVDPQVEQDREKARAVRLAPVLTTCSRVGAGLHPSEIQSV